MKNSAIKILATLGSLICLVACSNTSSVIFYEDSNSDNPSTSHRDTSSWGDFSDDTSIDPPVDDPYEIKLNGVKELRIPEGLSHKFNYNYYYDANFVSFRNKMKDFSAKLSAIIAKREYKSGENFVFSPLSVELCLGLAIRSASGTTRQELLDAIGIDYNTFNSNYKLYYDYLYKDVKNNMGYNTARLLFANSIWADDEANLKNNCLDALRDDYYCYSYEADFNGKNKETNDAIREFIKQATKGLIDQDLQLSPATLFVLMNVIYLKDIWNEVGSDLHYAPATYQFKNSDGSTSNKQLLYGNYNECRTMNNDDYSAFYTSTDSGFRIYFIKPNEGKNIKDIFNKDTINHVVDSNNYVYQDNEKLERYFTRCLFPEYEANGNFDLAKVFKEELNVTSIFGGSCNMSNLTDDNVYCSDFQQIAKLKVDKSGIEGAAVTYMAYAGAAGPDEYKEVYEDFIVDQEFGYVVASSDNIIFSGIVTNIDK